MYKIYAYYLKKDDQNVVDFDTEERVSDDLQLMPSHVAKFKGEEGTIVVFADGEFVWNRSRGKFVRYKEEA